jgi:N-acetylgalactosamine-6-sulfatase
MNRRSFLQSAAALAARPLLGQTKSGKRPNFIFILADDLGWGDLGCYGNRAIRTPSLDRLARQGTLFTQFYVNNPVCSPSRTAFMTGHFPAHHRMHGHLAAPEINANRAMPNFLDPSVTTVTRLLQKSGYRTAHYGKWHLGSGPGAPMPSAYGIDEHKTAVSNEKVFPMNDPWFWSKSSGMIVDEAIRFIEKTREQPFYINAWMLLPHAVLNPTDEQMEPYQRFAPAPYVKDRGAMRVYYSSVTNLDTEIGRLLKRLDELGLADDTVILFSSDNGPEDIHIANASHSAVGSPGPFRGRKRSLYEGGIRLPFLARWPGHIPAGRVENNAVLTAVDFLPTVSKLAGVNVPADVKPQGEDASDILFGASRARTKPIYWEWRFHIFGYNVNRSPILAIRDGKWKLLMNPDRTRVELYDIPNDPAEMTNLADRNPQVVRDLSEKVLAWQKTLPPGPIDPTAGKNDWPWPGATSR